MTPSPVSQGFRDRADLVSCITRNTFKNGVGRFNPRVGPITHLLALVRSQQGAIQKGKDLIQRFNSVENNEFIRQPFIVPWFVNQLNM